MAAFLIFLTYEFQIPSFLKPNDFNNYCNYRGLVWPFFLTERATGTPKLIADDFVNFEGLRKWMQCFTGATGGCGGQGVIFFCERTYVSKAAGFLLCQRTAQSKMVSKHVMWCNIRKPFWLMITIVLQFFFKAIQSSRSCINSTLKSQLSNKTGYCFAPAHLHFNWMKITDRGALWRHGSRQKLGRQEARAAGEGEWAEGRQWKTHIVHPHTHS